MPKIVQYNLPPGGTVVQLADNNSEALDIETINADGSTGDYITIDTTDSNEVLNLSAGGAAAKTLSVRSDGRAIWGNSNSFWQSYEDASATNPNSGPRKSDWDTGIGSPAVDQLSLVAGGQEGIRITEAGDAISAVNVNGSTTIQTGASGTAVDVVEVKASGGDTVAKINTTNTNGGEIVLYRGGSPAIGLDVNGGAYFNNPGLGVDFRVESDNNDHMFFLDGSEDKIGVGTSAPGQVLDINSGSGNMIADGYDTHSLAAYKENINEVDAGYLAKVTACSPKQWTRKPYVSADEIKAASVDQFGQDAWDGYFPEKDSHRAGALLSMPDGEMKTWIDAWADARREERRTEEKWQRVNIGLVADADDTAASFPESIARKDNGEISGINTMSYIGTLHAAIVELTARVATLEAGD